MHNIKYYVDDGLDNFFPDLKAFNIETDPTDNDHDDVTEENDNALGILTLHIDTTLTVHMSPCQGQILTKKSQQSGYEKIGNKI